MNRALTYALILFVAACSQAVTPDGMSSKADPTDKPKRIISLDLCADQYVLKFAERESILAVSPEANLPISYMRDAAAGIQTVRPLPENILNLQPDLVVRTYGGGPNAAQFFERAGIPVLNVGWTATMDDVFAVVERMADGLGEAEKGVELRSSLEKRLAAIKPSSEPKTALYMTASGYTSGTGTFIDHIFQKAGLQNFVQTAGWKSLPLEELTIEQPDLVALAYHENLDKGLETWSSTRNPIVTRMMTDKPTISLDGAIVSCSGWYLVDVIETLSKAANS